MSPYSPSVSLDTLKNSAGKRDGYTPESSSLSRCSQPSRERLGLLPLPEQLLQTFWRITLHPSYCFLLTWEKGCWIIAFPTSCQPSSTQPSLTPHWAQRCLPNPVTCPHSNKMALKPTLYTSSLGQTYLLWISVAEDQGMVVGWAKLGESHTLSGFAPHLYHEVNSYYLLCLLQR